MVNYVKEENRLSQISVFLIFVILFQIGGVTYTGRDEATFKILPYRGGDEAMVLKI